MTNTARRVFAKIRRDGIKAACKSTGQVLHAHFFPVRWDFELVPSVLEGILEEKGSATIVQIGANIGNTDSDQIYKFLAKHRVSAAGAGPRIRAVLIEP